MGLMLLQFQRESFDFSCEDFKSWKAETTAHATRGRGGGV